MPATIRAWTLKRTRAAKATGAITLFHASAHPERKDFERSERPDGHHQSLHGQAEGVSLPVDPASAHKLGQPPRENSVQHAVAGVRSDQLLAVAERRMVVNVVHHAARKTP